MSGEPTAVAADALLATGAEAELRRGRFLDRDVLEKVRRAKGYRHPRLDAALRDERTRDEANLLAAARRAGVGVPILYDVDRKAATLRIEPVAGPGLREALATAEGDAAAGLMALLGEAVARLHAAGLTHGDLTTGNVLVAPGDPPRVVLIDFGLGAASAESEPRGVDLHLLEESLEATHADASRLFAAFLDAYVRAGPGAAPAVARLDEIRQRGRYR